MTKSSRGDIYMYVFEKMVQMQIRGCNKKESAILQHHRTTHM